MGDFRVDHGKGGISGEGSSPLDPATVEGPTGTHPGSPRPPGPNPMVAVLLLLLTGLPMAATADSAEQEGESQDRFEESVNEELPFASGADREEVEESVPQEESEPEDFPQNRADELSREESTVQERQREREREQIQEEVTDVYLEGGSSADPDSSAGDREAEGVPEGALPEGGLAEPGLGIDFVGEVTFGLPVGAGLGWVPRPEPGIQGVELAGSMVDRIVGAALGDGAAAGMLAGGAGTGRLVGDSPVEGVSPGSSEQGGMAGVYGSPEGEAPGWAEQVGRRAGDAGLNTFESTQESHQHIPNREDPHQGKSVGRQIVDAVKGPVSVFCTTCQALNPSPNQPEAAKTGGVGAYDVDHDGHAEAWDNDNDGQPEEFDTTGDGEVDAYDTNGDGKADEFHTDDGDSRPDLFDTNGDGKADAVDTDSDGVPDYFDTDGDGQADAKDTDGDGEWDVRDVDMDGSYEEDRDGDVKDTDGDGTADASYPKQAANDEEEDESGSSSDDSEDGESSGSEEEGSSDDEGDSSEEGDGSSQGEDSSNEGNDSSDDEGESADSDDGETLPAPGQRKGPPLTEEEKKLVNRVTKDVEDDIESARTNQRTTTPAGPGGRPDPGELDLPDLDGSEVMMPVRPGSLDMPYVYLPRSAFIDGAMGVCAYQAC